MSYHLELVCRITRLDGIIIIITVKSLNIRNIQLGQFVVY